ncbi:MAG: hypothetical protein Q4G59_08890, partial [Planctomycetia bacterium]|nr:hypothetical protein [Planctomycetia bacterium]
RLVRKICPQCRIPFRPTEEQLAELELSAKDIEGKQFFQGEGCVACNNTGYKGRTAIHEFLLVNDEIRDLILNKGSVLELRNAAARNGMIPLRNAGMDKVFQGITTIDEVVRETVLDN